MTSNPPANFGLIPPVLAVGRTVNLVNDLEGAATFVSDMRLFLAFARMYR